MPLAITSLYAGLLGLVLLALAFRAGSFRGKNKISVGDGGNSEMLVRMRAHGNAAEFVPILLILLAILETNGANSTLLHGLGIAMVITRILHPIGLKADNIAHPLRAIGAGGSALVLLICSVYAVWLAVS